MHRGKNNGLTRVRASASADGPLSFLVGFRHTEHGFFLIVFGSMDRRLEQEFLECQYLHQNSWKGWTFLCARIRRPGMFKCHSFAIDPFRLVASEDAQGSCVRQGSRMEQMTITYKTLSNDTITHRAGTVPSNDQRYWNGHGRER
eukprot:scaffold465_cov383-Pavlova_lutheri.AAC.13